MPIGEGFLGRELFSEMPSAPFTSAVCTLLVAWLGALILGESFLSFKSPNLNSCLWVDWIILGPLG